MRSNLFKTFFAGLSQEAVLGFFAFILACYCVFFLAYDFPNASPMFTTSYVAGYSNRVASVSLSFIAVAVFFGACFIFRNRSSQESTAQSTPHASSRLFIVCAIVCAVVYTVALTLLSVDADASPRFFGETSYFLPVVGRVSQFGDIPYRQFEFPYGPILLYVPFIVIKALSPLGVAPEPAYYVSLVLMMLAGLAILFWIVNDRDVAIDYKPVTFTLLAVAFLNVTLGQNYTPVRFLADPALLLLLYKVWRASARITGILRLVAIAAAVIASSILASGIGPEAGVAFAGSAFVFLLVLAIQGDLWLLALLPLCFAGLASMLAIFGMNFFSSALRFSTGYFNILIVPAPYILFYIVILVYLVPVGIARTMREEPRRSALFLSLGVLGLAYVSAALGRCDPGHVMWNGSALFLLAFALVGRYWKKFQFAYVVVFAVLFTIGLHVSGEYLYRGRISRATYHAAKRYLPRSLFQKMLSIPMARKEADKFAEADAEDTPDITALEKVTGVATPFETDKRIDSYLSSHGKSVRDYFTWMDNVSDRASLDVKLKTLAASPYSLVDFENCGGEEDLDTLSHLIMFPIRFKVRYPRWSPSNEVRSYVETNFDKVRPIGRYWLYRKRVK